MRYMRMLGGAAVVLASMVLSAPAWAASPSVVGSVSDPVNLSGIRTVAVSGHYAYSPSYYNGELTAIDISNPAHPTVVGETAPPSSNLNAVNALYNADFITIANGFAYVTSKNANTSSSQDNGTGNGLTIFNLQNPAAPTWAGFISDTSTGNTHLFGAYGVAVSGNLAYVSAQGCLIGTGQPPCASPAPGNDVEVINVSNPSSPAEAATITNPVSGPHHNALQHADGITVSGNTAFVVAAYGQDLTSIALNPTSPTSDTVQGTLFDSTHLAFPNDVAVSGNYAYVADGGSSGLTVVNVSNPAAPAFATELTNTELKGAYRVAIHDTTAYVAADAANAITVIDVSNPLTPSILASVGDGSRLNHTSGLDFALAGRYVIASSPFLSTEAQPAVPPFPYPYPVADGGSPSTSDTNTGTISVLDMDPNPVAVHITSPAAGASYKPGQSVTAAYACTPGGLFAIATCQGPVASGAKVDTKSPGKHTFTVTGTDQDGQTGTATVTYTVLPPPAITHLKQTHRRWREHGKASSHLPPIGTAFTFTLNETSRITLSFTRLVGPGRKVGKRCVVQTNKNRHHRRCERTAPAGKLTFRGKHGANRIAFNGKVKGKFLKPGTYTVTITVTANGKSVSRTLTFTIVA
jgi:hypothetical protein